MAMGTVEGVIIVSRHPAAVEFILRASGLPEETPVVATATVTDVADRIVYGNLPLHLAAMARVVVAVEFSGQPPRGAEYTADDMVAAGARLQLYFVNAVSVNGFVSIDDEGSYGIRGDGTFGSLQTSGLFDY